MSVRAKFKVVEVTEESVKLVPVTSGSKENDTFFKYTPDGQISMRILNPPALSQFEEDAEFYVDFNRVE
jgi:hypothetical protein